MGTFGPPEVLPLSLLLFFEACSVRFGNVSVRKTALIPARTAARLGKKKINLFVFYVCKMKM